MVHFKIHRRSSGYRVRGLHSTYLLRNKNPLSACTGWFGRLGPLSWEHCCLNHDAHDDEINMLPYDREFFRLLADEELRACVNKVLPMMGDIMFLGVRTFGPWYRWLIR